MSKLVFVLVAVLAATVMAQTPAEKADFALAAARLAESTEPVSEPCSWRYIHNPDLPIDAIELAPEEDVQPSDFFNHRPLERPAGVPGDFVPVKVFQLRQGYWRFLGWMLMSINDVQELHADLVTT